MQPTPSFTNGHNPPALVANILAAYAIPYISILPPQKGYRNTSYRVCGGSADLNVMVYKSEPAILLRIHHANNVGDFLAQAGLPARRLHDPRILKLQANNRVQYAAVYNYLPGQTIPWEAYTMAHIKQLGRIMSDMHAKLATYDGDLPDVTDELLALNKRMQHYFASPDVQRALKQKLSLVAKPHDFTALLQQCKNLRGQQALHMDFVRSNILFQGTTVTGILDFEKAARGHPAFDMARTLAFLLVDCKYKLPRKTYKYFVRSGYNKYGAATLTATQLLAKLVPFFLWHDFYKFLRHNPYEFLPQNEHLTRTTTLLLKRGLLSDIK